MAKQVIGGVITLDWTEEEEQKIERFRKNAEIRAKARALFREHSWDYWEDRGIYGIGGLIARMMKEQENSGKG
jgi:hypothetical protein